MAQRRDTQLFEVLISQIAQYREIDVVVGKALRVVRHDETLEPVRNVLHSTSRKLVLELEVSILSDTVQTRQSSQAQIALNYEVIRPGRREHLTRNISLGWSPTGMITSAVPHGL